MAGDKDQHVFNPAWKEDPLSYVREMYYEGGWRPWEDYRMGLELGLDEDTVESLCERLWEYECKELEKEDKELIKRDIENALDPGKLIADVYAGGWRAGDRDLIRDMHRLTENEADEVCELLQQYEDKHKEDKKEGGKNDI